MRDLINQQAKQPNLLTKFLWRAAGADDRILARTTYTDHVKYASIGGIICFTALLAGVSAGFAIYSIFSHKFSPEEMALLQRQGKSAVDTGVLTISIIFAIIWGIMIYNLDRFIVSATGKGDGKEGISWYDLSLGWPRLLMALIIGLVISAPLEIKIMEPEIEEQLEKTISEKKKSFETIELKRFETDHKEIFDQLTKLKGELKTIGDRKEDLNNQYVAEARTITVGPRALAVKAELTKAEEEYNKKQNEITILNKKIDELKKNDYTRRMDNYESKIRNGSGLLSRLSAAEHYAENEGSEAIPWLIRLFFIVLEVTPVLTKMMLVKSPYDYLEENLGEIVKAKEAIEIRHDFLKDDNGKLISKAINYVPLQIIKEQQEVLLAQEKVSQEIVERWKERETNNIKDNLEDYLEK